MIIFLPRHGASFKIFSCLQHYTFLLLLEFLVKTMPQAQTPDQKNFYILNSSDIHYIHEQYVLHCTDLFICINIDYWVLTKVSLLIMMTSFAPWPCALLPLVNSVHPPLCIATAASFMYSDGLDSFLQSGDFASTKGYLGYTNTQ